MTGCGVVWSFSSLSGTGSAISSAPSQLVRFVTSNMGTGEISFLHLCYPPFFSLALHIMKDSVSLTHSHPYQASLNFLALGCRAIFLDALSVWGLVLFIKKEKYHVPHSPPLHLLLNNQK